MKGDTILWRVSQPRPVLHSWSQAILVFHYFPTSSLSMTNQILIPASLLAGKQEHITPIQVSQLSRLQLVTLIIWAVIVSFLPNDSPKLVQCCLSTWYSIIYIPYYCLKQPLKIVLTGLKLNYSISFLISQMLIIRPLPFSILLRPALHSRMNHIQSLYSLSLYY